MRAGERLDVGHLDVEGYEQVVRCRDAASGLHAIVAVHSTVLGPALGGTRFHAYDEPDEALTDVLRLARGMTYKASVSGLDLGGGKAVILGDPDLLRTDELVLAYGRFVDSLGGAYVTAEDVGTTQADMDLIRSVTPHVTGVSESLGGSGDPSPATALGLLHALRAAAAHRFGTDDLSGVHVAVSGVGKVGSVVVEHLAVAGARVTVADVDATRVADAVRAHGVEVASPAAIHTVTCDVFSPCALGGILNAATIPDLRCAVVCGSANNQLLERADGDRLAAAGVLYVPDYVVNAGGIINIAEELGGYDAARAGERIAAISTTTAEVLRLADDEGTTPAEAADRLAERRVAAAAGRTGD
ncbi:MAG: Glu/Leu/Phe/Val dehydrogenase dimerization domain-containing protein [Acidimicrobiales bacterium]